MFPSNDNISGLKVIKSVLDDKEDKFPPTACIIEALKLCLECNNSAFNNNHFLQSDGTAQGPHCDVLVTILSSSILMLSFRIYSRSYLLEEI